MPIPTRPARTARASRRAVLLSAVLLLAGGGAVACGGGDARTTPPLDAQLQTGATVYRKFCSTCHGLAGQGVIGPEVTAEVIVEKYPDVAAHRAVIVEGRAAMPAWGKTLTPAEVDAVVRYQREILGR